MSKNSADSKKLRRLRYLLALFFVVLLIPVGALLFFAFEQMKWEVFHQFRQQAEALSGRINNDIALLMETENARRVIDYEFLAPQQPSGVLEFERTALSQLPEDLNIAGLVGHFQIGPEGKFSTPLVPGSDLEISRYGVNAADFAKRVQISERLRQILTADTRSPKPTPDSPTPAPNALAEQVKDDSQKTKARDDSPKSEALESSGLRNAPTAISREVLSQFDAKTNQAYQRNQQRLGSVAELELDDSLELKAKKSGAPSIAHSEFASPSDSESLAKIRRKERVPNYDLARSADSTAQESIAADTSSVAGADASEQNEFSVDEEVRLVVPSSATPVRDTEARETAKSAVTYPSITSFESEVEGFRLSVFDDDYLVLHRNVWQNGRRIVQGAIFDREALVEEFVRKAFLGTSLANMSQLVIAFQDDVLNIFTAPSKYRYTSSADSLTGQLLFQTRLVQPFQGFSLIFNITNLPLGTSIKYLAWVTAVMFGVLVAGFYFIYRYGKNQIALLRQQQDFVSAVSHELKTPLTSIRMYSEMLKNGWANDKKKIDYYEYIHSESERLSRLIDNVLQLARINRNHANQKNDWIGVGELLANAVSSISSLAETNGFNIEQRFSPAACRCKILANADACQQIIINIVDNAIKFSREAEIKNIEFRAELLSNGGVEIAIRDHGPGINETQMKKIFELFYRSENELTRETVGTGIGLNLVHELATKMGATVDVRNCQPGVEFSVLWPAKRINQDQTA